MTHINLLPWREELLKANNIIFGLIAGTIVLSCLIVSFIVSAGIQGLIEYEISEVNLISQETSMLEGKIASIKGLKKQQDLLLSRREVIQALEASRLFIVMLFEDIAKAVPDGLFLVSMSRKDNKLTIGGISNSNSRISAFMLNLKKLKWLDNTNLQEIKRYNVQVTDKNGTQEKQIEFELQGNINY